MKDHVAIVILGDEGKTLFIQRSMKKSTLPGAWSFPSGTREEGESIEMTVCREAQEELGVTVQARNIPAKMELPEFNTRLHFVVCIIINGTPTINDKNEINEIRWMDFPTFFKTFNDEEIGHGLVWLRKNNSVWKSLLI